MNGFDSNSQIIPETARFTEFCGSLGLSLMRIFTYLFNRGMQSIKIDQILVHLFQD